jgi:hypothetical protein
MSWTTVNDQRNPPGDAQITYGITSAGGTFNLRSTGTVDYEVEWGDGTVERSTSNVLAHTYAAGSYVLKVRTSQTYRPFFSNSTDEDQITSVALVSDLDVGTSLSRAWLGANNMTDFNAAFGATTGVVDFSLTWLNCASLTSFPSIDTSSGSNFQQTWQNCASLTSFPLIDTSSGSNFNYTWRGCTSLTSFPLIDTSSGTTFSNSWANCSSLTSFPANMFDTTGTLISSAFDVAWTNCALTAQSIENILVSLDTNGATGIILSINGGTTAGQSSWTAAATTAYNNLIAKGWTITANP